MKSLLKKLNAKESLRITRHLFESIQKNSLNTKFESDGNIFFCMLGKDKGVSFVLPIVEHLDQTD